MRAIILNKFKRNENPHKKLGIIIRNFNSEIIMNDNNINGHYISVNTREN